MLTVNIGVALMTGMALALGAGASARWTTPVVAPEGDGGADGIAVALGGVKSAALG